MWDFARATDQVRQLRRVVRRETVRLVVLTAVAGGVFLGTRLIAGHAEQRELADAERWYERGTALLESSPEAAAVAFRRAVLKNRDDERFVLALADALRRSGNIAAAVRALQGLREFRPEDQAVNLALARLHREQGQPSTALRYYHHAIYAADTTPQRSRAVRLELIESLLAARDTARAQSELIAAAIDAPETPEAHLQLGSLFERAGNAARAEEHFRAVLEDEPRNAPALEGAVRTAFAQGNYARVLTYALSESAAPDVRALAEIAREVINRNPLGSRVSAAERRRRLQRTVTYLKDRWANCARPLPAAPQVPESLVLLERMSQSANIGRDTEALEAAVGQIDQARRDVEQQCGDRTVVDEALIIIARAHDAGAQ